MSKELKLDMDKILSLPKKAVGQAPNNHAKVIRVMYHTQIAIFPDGTMKIEKNWSQLCAGQNATRKSPKKEKKIINNFSKQSEEVETL